MTVSEYAHLYVDKRIKTLNELNVVVLEYYDMPRARTTTTEEESITIAPKRAPRKRVVKSGDGEVLSAPKPRAVRKRTPAKPEESRLQTEADVTVSERRAPTPLKAARTSAVKGRRAVWIALIFFVVLAGSGVLVGMTDKGAIDVVAVVNERNERINRGEVRNGESTITVPVQNTDSRPNGGLVPADAPTVTETPTTETSSSTKETASSSSETLNQSEVSSTTEVGV